MSTLTQQEKEYDHHTISLRNALEYCRSKFCFHSKDGMRSSTTNTNRTMPSSFEDDKFQTVFIQTSPPFPTKQDDPTTDQHFTFFFEYSMDVSLQKNPLQEAKVCSERRKLAFDKFQRKQTLKIEQGMVIQKDAAISLNQNQDEVKTEHVQRKEVDDICSHDAVLDIVYILPSDHPTIKQMTHPNMDTIFDSSLTNHKSYSSNGKTILSQSYECKSDTTLLPVIRPMTLLEFKMEYIYSNIPCIIRGLDLDEFAKVIHLWRLPKCHLPLHDDDGYLSSNNYDINTDWFLNSLGRETLVPIRHHGRRTIYHNSKNKSSLDPEGRAMECTTTHMRMEDWIQQMEQLRSFQTRIVPTDELGRSFHVFDTRNTNLVEMDPDSYLKDWHLQHILQYDTEPNLATFTDTNFSHPPNVTSQTSLYLTPNLFSRDLLNHFLCSFTDADYRFVYWGPAGSKTLLHSDVLHTYSWSFNVSGEKEWTFVRPNENDTDIRTTNLTEKTAANDIPFTIRQKSGETIFVPAEWKHEVTNIMETISINHNWIVPSLLDRTWACIRQEIHAIEKEMKLWGLDSYQVRENMLRGCLGLDVSSFFFMILVGIIDTMASLDLLNKPRKSEENFWIENDHQWELWFDLACMMYIMDSITYNSVIPCLGLEQVDHEDVKEARLISRLEATLGSYALAQNAVHLWGTVRLYCPRNRTEIINTDRCPKVLRGKARTTWCRKRIRSFHFSCCFR